MDSMTVLNGRYELLDRLGEGGVAVVYRARDAILNRPVAVKVLREQYASDPAFLARFQREAQAAARLSHPNIVAVYDVGQANGQYYIVMEYVEGENLKAFITRNGPLPVGLALGIAEQVCAGLALAHAQGFVHRDIKPQNILVALDLSSGGNGRADNLAGRKPPLVKVTDFGLARSLGAAATSEGNEVLGTVQYISPEQARGERATPASDIYALGVVLYEMLTGRLPFTGEIPVAIALRHIQEDPVRPSRINPRVPPTVDGFVLRAMAKDARQRFPSAADMEGTLSSYRQFGEEATGHFKPVQAPPPQLPRSAAGAAGRPVAAPARPAPRPAPRRRGFDWLLVILLLLAFAAIAGLVPLAYAVRDAVFPPAPTPPPQVSVPSLVGLDRAEAERQLEAQGLHLTVAEERFDDRMAAGHVVAQLVPTGTRLAKDETVEVILSRGKERVRVTQVIGLTYDEAQRRLAAQKLQADRRDAPSAQAAVGTVTAQDPPPNAEVDLGALVHLTVSAGDKVIVPDLLGKSEADAQQMIQNAGLQTTYANYQERNDVPAGNRWVFDVVPVGGVISQEPPSGALVDRGTLVRLAVRKK